jgi:hypothetical protein
MRKIAPARVGHARTDTIVKRIACVLGVTLVAAGAAQAQEVDLRIATGQFGYGFARIAGLGSVPDQVARGFNARLDVHIVSLMLRNLPVRTYDALFGDVTYGSLASDTLHGLFSGDVQPRHGLSYLYGYQFLAGVQRSGVAVLGGLGWQEFYHDIGGSTMSGTSTPLIARVEIGGRRAIVVTGWKSVSGAATVGARVDVPFFRRLNLTAMYWQSDGMADLWSRGANGPLSRANARMLVVGVRSAEIR